MCIEFSFQVENLGTSPTSEVRLAFSPAEAEHLAVVKAAITTGKRKKKTYVPLDVKSAGPPDGPNGSKFFSVTLLTPLGKGETTTLEVLYILTNSLEPFPVEISQSESQLVYFRDSAILLSPYHVKQQTTFIKTPSARVESFTVVEPTKRAGTELKYGPYDNHAPYSYSPVLVHFENNNPFAVVEELEREIEISHWGSIQVIERYRLTHAGARHKGVFSRYICYLFHSSEFFVIFLHSFEVFLLFFLLCIIVVIFVDRVEYQTRSGVSGVSSFKHLLAKLPPRVHSVYYRDEIGNISSSHLRKDFLKVRYIIWVIK
jgi:oligosaccharyltransferase complex subunit alpha (ribophorin I)